MALTVTRCSDAVDFVYKASGFSACSYGICGMDDATLPTTTAVSAITTPPTTTTSTTTTSTTTTTPLTTTTMEGSAY